MLFVFWSIAIIILSHVKMKVQTFICVLALLALSLSQPTCLLDEPLKDSCLESIELSMVEQELTKYLCTISYQRKLYSKAEEFCRQAFPINYESGYPYFSSLLANKNNVAALKIDYMLFFTNPFDHNSLLNNSLTEIAPKLQEIQESIAQLPVGDHFDLSIFYFYRNETEKSLTHLKLHLQEYKDDLELIYEHFLMMRILEKQYKYYEALEYITKVIKTNTAHHPYLYHLKGNFLMHHIQFQKAITEFETANAEFHKMYKSNGFSFSNYNIGLCYEKLGKIDQAIKYYQKSIINLNAAETLNALGHAHFSQFQKTKSKKDLLSAQLYYKKALDINPAYQISTFNMGMLELEKKNATKSILYFEKCRETIQSCKYGLIKAYYQLNNTDKVEETLGQIERNDDVVTQLAAILYEMGDFNRALDIVGDKVYKSAELYEWKGFNQYALDRYEQAQSSFARAVFLGSKKGYIYYSLGLSQLHLKRYEDCTRSFGHAYKLDPRKDTKQHLQKCKKLSESNDL